MKTQTAILDLQGAHCASCVYAIEHAFGHAGRKVAGVHEVSVNAGKQEIEVTYEGNPASLDRIVEIVKTIGYQARVRRQDGRQSP
jgi:copper chaperone CopZ